MIDTLVNNNNILVGIVQSFVALYNILQFKRHKNINVYDKTTTIVLK